MLKDVRSIAQQSGTAKTIFTVLAKRLRARPQIDLSKLKHDLKVGGYKVSGDDFIETFRGLERAGAGELKPRRGKAPRKFKWYYNLRSVAQVALGEDTEGSGHLSPSVRKAGFIEPPQTKVLREASDFNIIIKVEIPVKQIKLLIHKLKGV